MGFCELRDKWQSLTPAERAAALTQYMQDLMRDWGMDPSKYQIKYEPVPGNPDANGGYDYANDTIYINPDLLQDDEPFNDTTAAETAAHEVRHGMQDEVYEDYGVSGGTANPLDVGMREEDAESFADSLVPDGLEDCKDPDAESSARDRQEMPPPASPAGDWNVPSGDTAYA